MKKLMMLALCASVLGFSTASAQAQDMLIIDDGNDSVVEGVVKKVRTRDLTIDVSGKDVTVEIDDLNIRKADEYFPVGTKVQVVGKIKDDDEIAARKMIRLETPPEESAPAETTTPAQPLPEGQ